MARQLLRLSVAAAILTIAALAVTSPMPFRPGMGLGSWIPEDMVESMKEEAERRSEIYTLNNLEAEARSLERELALAAKPVTGEDPLITAEQDKTFKNQLRDTRNKLFGRKVAAITDLINSIESAAKVTTTGGASGAPHSAKKGMYSTFGKAYSSPVDWKKATLKAQDRSFDSLNVGVHFVQHDKVDEDGSGDAYAQKILGTLKNNTHDVSGRTTDVETQAATVAASKARQTASTHRIEGTLLVTAFATHRMVKQFDTFAIDVDELWRGWNYMHPAEMIANPLLQKDKFEEQIKEEQKKDQAKVTRASIVSEVHLGSVIVGMVHFVQRETSTISHNTTTDRNASKLTKDFAENVRQAQKLASLVGSTEIATDTARRFAKLGSEAGLNVQFDMVTIGFIPALATNEVQLTVSKFKDFDPANFKVPTMLDSDAEMSTAAAMVQSNMQAVISATVEAVDRSSSSHKVLSSAAFMDAFSDFAASSKSGAAIGAPIGLNIKQFSKLDILGALANKYLGMGIALGVDLGV